MSWISLCIFYSGIAIECMWLFILQSASVYLISEYQSVYKRVLWSLKLLDNQLFISETIYWFLPTSCVTSLWKTLIHILSHSHAMALYCRCSERSYDKSKFHGCVQDFPFDDHHPPSFDVIGQFCADVDSWLKQDTNHVAVVHCKAGKVSLSGH